ncbi:MAG: MBL fold metallo-hydrolase [Bacteroidota bacterium]
MKLQFFGAAQTVTGSKHIITTDKGTKILLDCGLFQGIGTQEMNQTFGFDPSEIDYMVLSHAHIDHTGLLPRLVAKGFKGPIFCTSATRDLAEILLGDSAKIQSNDLKRVNERRIKRGENALELLYGEDDVVQTLDQMRSMTYRDSFQVCEEVSCIFMDAGHILGSASVNLTIKENNGQTIRLTFTGDIGRPSDRILKSPEPFPQADYIICESTYGNRLHPAAENVKAELLELVHNICVKNRGKILIPAFSVGRTQEIVYALDQLEEEGLLPKIPIFVDSPLSVKATGVMRKHRECYNPQIMRYLHEGDGDAFGFDHLTYISEKADSIALNDSKGPAVIISASGMAEAGRIKHHIANNISDPNCAILFVGYCSPEGLGGRLKAGEKQVRIFGNDYQVNCQIHIMDSFSAHGDYSELIQFLDCQNKAEVKKIFLVHGELETQIAFKKRLQDIGWGEILIPKMFDQFELS